MKLGWGRGWGCCEAHLGGHGTPREAGAWGRVSPSPGTGGEEEEAQIQPLCCGGRGKMDKKIIPRWGRSSQRWVRGAGERGCQILAGLVEEIKRLKD